MSSALRTRCSLVLAGSATGFGGLSRRCAGNSDCPSKLAVFWPPAVKRRQIPIRAAPTPCLEAIKGPKEEHALLQGIEPDMAVLGKAMGNGFPLSAVVMTERLAAAFAAGPLYFNTFAGSNAACVSGLAVLREVQQRGLQEHAWQVGKSVLSALQAVQQTFPEDVGDVRGQGLFLGIELVTSAASRAPAPGKAKWVKERMKAHKVCGSCPETRCRLLAWSVAYVLSTPSMAIAPLP